MHGRSFLKLVHKQGIYNINLKQMKQETIDLIKSMTEQGFLVIVDPEKLNDQDGVIIKVMAWKDTDNKAEVTLTACDVKINVEIDELAGCKKEEPKPEIDLLQCDGRRFRAKIKKIVCDGRISVEDGRVFLCQKSLNGNAATDRKGFEWSWSVGNGTHDCLIADDVTDFELLPEPRVIFTNCVGEVFTEEDKKNRLNVFWASFNPLEIRQGGINIIKIYSALGKHTTDIFRSKKSLLKYLYETCE